MLNVTCKNIKLYSYSKKNIVSECVAIFFHSDSSEEITQEETIIEVPHRPAEEVPQVSQVQEKELVAPKFVTRIDDIKAQEGEEVKFIVKVTGKPTPEVTWHHDNEIIKDSEIYRVVQGEEGEVTLLLTEAFPEDSGVYTVTASNEAGQAECTAMLTVTGKTLVIISCELGLIV